MSPEDSKDAEEMKAELAAAQKGVLGMMHFANYDSPLLLEALGDLLIAWPTYKDDALQLAARAYYRVAQLSEDEATKDEFKKAAANMVYGHLDYINYRKANRTKRTRPKSDLEKLSADLNRELAEAQAYFDSIAADERRWIAEGVDVDQAFAAKYYDSLESTIEEAKKQLATERRDVRGSPYQEAINRGTAHASGRSWPASSSSFGAPVSPIVESGQGPTNRTIIQRNDFAEVRQRGRNRPQTSGLPTSGWPSSWPT